MQEINSADQHSGRHQHRRRFVTKDDAQATVIHRLQTDLNPLKEIKCAAVFDLVMRL